MTRNGRRASMQRRVEWRSVPIKTRGLDPRKVGRAISAKRKTARTNRTPPMRGCTMPSWHQGEGGGAYGERRSGIAGAMASPGQRGVASERCRGRKPQERRPVDHVFPVKRRRSCGALTPKPCTRPDRRRRLGPQCLKGRSRAGASKRTPTLDDCRISTHLRCARVATERRPSGQSRCGRRVFRIRLPRRPKRGRDERPDWQQPGRSPSAVREPLKRRRRTETNLCF